MNAAFKAEFGTGTRVDIKFNTLELRNKEAGDESEESTLTLRQIMEKYKPYSIHENLLNEHRRLRSSRSAQPPSVVWPTDEEY
ncbi:MAG: hypothetical protein VR64_21335 [Desulfatitalea sp. BRH_c12]|nr:MAG: hypothetical protein VR64_21335 [Desulfatitalea sp. BRH_c12]